MPAPSPKSKKLKVVIAKKKKPNPFADTDSSGHGKSSSRDKSTLDSSYMKKAINRAVASEYGSPLSLTDMEARLDEEDTGHDGGVDAPDDDDDDEVIIRFL